MKLTQNNFCVSFVMLYKRMKFSECSNVNKFNFVFCSSGTAKEYLNRFGVIINQEQMNHCTAAAVDQRTVLYLFTGDQLFKTSQTDVFLRTEQFVILVPSDDIFVHCGKLI